MSTNHLVHITQVSGNRKVGPIPVTTSSRATCPDTCSLKGAGCYADGGPLALHWEKVTRGERGVSYDNFISWVRGLPRGQLWRHNQAGDLAVTEKGRLDRRALGELERAARRTRPIIYTHHREFRVLERSELAINFSAESVSEAVRVKRRYPELNVVCVLPAPKKLADGSYERAEKVQVRDGVRIVKCPAENKRSPKKVEGTTALKTENITCARCELCARGRDYVIGFEAHGSRKRAADVIARG